MTEKLERLTVVAARIEQHQRSLPHEGLEVVQKPEQKAIIEADFGMVNGTLVTPTRRALVKYVLQRFQIDPKKLDPKASAQQIVVRNLDELKPWLYE